MVKAVRVSMLLMVACCAFGSASVVSAQAVTSDEVPEGLTASEWSSIRAEYEAGRHAAQAIDGGYRARNPGQQWTTSFDGRGFTTTPDEGGWGWGLDLHSYGRDGEERRVTTPQVVTADGPRVAYHWNEQLTEWWVNDGRGLEHGYTVHDQPAGTSELALDLAIRGNLRAVVSGDGRDVSFVGPKGSTLVTYAGLTVFDASGQALTAGFEPTDTGLRLTVDDRGARYPLTIDPIAQQAYLKASNTDSDDYFGGSVSVSGDTVVVGAYQEDSSATGVDGDQYDNSASSAGAAYVFVRNGTTWSQQAYLKASNAESGDRFGYSVSISGDTVVVGAYQESSAATGVDGDQSNNSASSAGAAYVFVRNGTTWSQQAYLKASNTGFADRFGISVSIAEDTVVVGAHNEDSSTTGVDGDQGDNSAVESGAAYVFVRNGTTWSQQAYLKASNTDAGDFFGWSVAASGDTIVVGASREASSATGVDGDQSDNSAWWPGAAYVFVRQGTAWNQQAYLKASNAEGSFPYGDEFGFSVSVSGDTIVVGAPDEESSATGVDGDQSDNSSSQSGAAYVFVRNGATWSQQAYLKASNTNAGDDFGWSTSVSGDRVVVGARWESSPATGINGDQGDSFGSYNAGAAYVFTRSGTTWSQQAYLKASNTGFSDYFGSSISISGDTVVVGSLWEDSSATGVDGDQSDVSSFFDAGAAYVFDLEAPAPNAWTDQGCALAGALGEPYLEGSGTLVANSVNQVSLSNAAPDALSAVFIGFASNPIPFKGGILKPNPFLNPLFLQTSATGTITIPFVMAAAVPAGTEIWVQFAIREFVPFPVAALSNAILGVTP